MFPNRITEPTTHPARTLNESEKNYMLGAQLVLISQFRQAVLKDLRLWFTGSYPTAELIPCYFCWPIVDYETRSCPHVQDVHVVWGSLLENTPSKATSKQLGRNFSHFGMPETMVAEPGPQSASEEFYHL